MVDGKADQHSFVEPAPTTSQPSATRTTRPTTSMKRITKDSATDGATPYQLSVEEPAWEMWR